jgi:signal transduction histidine kinase
MGSAVGRWEAALSLRVPLGRGTRREQVLATFRLVISLICLVALCLDGSWSGGYGVLGRLIPLLYVLYSATVLAAVSLSDRLPESLLVLIQTADIVWAALVCLLTSPFFFLFVFALVAAACRWDGRAILLTAIGSAFALLFEFVVLHPGSSKALPGEEPSLSVLVVRGLSLLVLGGLLAYLSERKRQLEDVSASADSILQNLRPDAGVQENLKDALPEFLRIFAAKSIVLVVRDCTNGRVFELALRSEGRRSGLLQRRLLTPSRADQYLVAMPGKSWSLIRSNDAVSPAFLAFDRAGQRVRSAQHPGCAGSFKDESFRDLCAVNVQFGNEWTGRVFLFDSHRSMSAESRLRLFQQLVDEVAPAIYHSYLWRRIRVRARSIERNRIARDLHDGVIQALINLEIEIDSLRRRSTGTAPDPAATLEKAQSVLRQEVRNLRGMIEQLRGDGTPSRLEPCLAEMVAKFTRETGITASFGCDSQAEQLPRPVAQEVKQIVQEALSNVRKHSGAQNVDVRLTASQDSCRVVIQDDGRGFDFCGRLSQAQLLELHKGPRVIQERVHCVRGELAIESYPDRGARLEISLATNG